MPALPPLLLDGRPPVASDLDWLLASRALAFGEGVFTTARVFQGQVVFLDAHLHRLQNALAALRYAPSNFDWQVLRSEIQETGLKLEQGMLKVMLLAGSGQGGYRRDKNQKWHRLVHPRQFELNLAAYAGVHCWWQACSGDNPATASKHLNRLSQVLASERCPSSYVEALQYNTQGIINEAIARTIFWYAQGRWHTPDLSTGAMAGVMRRQILEHLGSKQVQEVAANFAVLQEAQEVFICNSLQGIWPVLSLNTAQGRIASWDSGAHTRQLMAVFHPSLGLPIA